MARKKIFEYKAKSILLGDAYKGIEVKADSDINQILVKFSNTQNYVVKVDQGEKKRFKRGLIKINIPGLAVESALNELKQKGFSQFLIEDYQEHEAELYLSLEQVREGVKLVFSNAGGVEIEANIADNLQTFIIKQESDLEHIAAATLLDLKFLANLYHKFVANYFALLEVNPLVRQGPEFLLLDCAVLVDDSAKLAVEAWTEKDFVSDKTSTIEEIAVAQLDANTPASLKLQVLNAEGSIGMLLSSGGASIVIADEIFVRGKGRDIINYGEYSGGPTREETYQYAKNVLSLVLKSKSQNKVLIIAGGVANFTDIYQTFMGIIDALDEVKHELQNQKIKVFVRRGGPNEAKGLKNMENFLVANDLFGCVYGSDIELTRVIAEALDFQTQNS